VLDRHTALLGADHPDTLTTRHGLVNVLRAMGKDREADLLGAVVGNSLFPTTTHI
jgi:hypothetical protein